MLVQLGYFYTLYDSTEISQVDTRNAREYGKEAEKANEDRPQSLRSLLVPLPINTPCPFPWLMSEYDGGTFRCTVCAKEFLSKDEADRHFSDSHADERTNVME